MLDLVLYVIASYALLQLPWYEWVIWPYIVRKWIIRHYRLCSTHFGGPGRAYLVVQDRASGLLYAYYGVMEWKRLLNPAA